VTLAAGLAVTSWDSKGRGLHGRRTGVSERAELITGDVIGDAANTLILPALSGRPLCPMLLRVGAEYKRTGFAKSTVGATRLLSASGLRRDASAASTVQSPFNAILSMASAVEVPANCEIILNCILVSFICSSISFISNRVASTSFFNSSICVCCEVSWWAASSPDLSMPSIFETRIFNSAISSNVPASGVSTTRLVFGVCEQALSKTDASATEDPSYSGEDSYAVEFVEFRIRPGDLNARLVGGGTGGVRMKALIERTSRSALSQSAATLLRGEPATELLSESESVN